MALYYGRNANIRLNTVPLDKVDLQEDYGRVRQSTDFYTWTGSELNGDQILLGRIPANAMITQVFLLSRFAFFAAASPISVGWAQSVNAIEDANSTGFGSAASPAVNWSAFPAAWASGAFGAQAVGHYKTFADETQVMLTLGANVVAGAATKVLVCGINFIVD